jgi:integrase/recombinase XerD
MAAGVVAGDPADPRGFPVLVARFLEHLAVRNYAAATLSNAESALSLFSAWCDERGIGRPEEVSRQVVERYQRWLYHFRRESGRPLSTHTQYNRLVHAKSFFRFLARERYLLYNPASELEMPRLHRRLPTGALSVPEVEAVLAQPDVSTPLGVRDRAILETLYSTGMRRKEAIGLDLYDVDCEREWVAIRHGKGGKQRVVPIGARALAWIGKYVEEVRPELVVSPSEPALFLSRLGGRLTEHFTHRVRHYVEASGVRDRGGCHLFRHTCATLMLEGGADLRSLQEMLGHAKLENTQIYTHVSIERLKRVHAATHPAHLVRQRSLGAELAGDDEEAAEELLLSLAAGSDEESEELDGEASEGAERP